MLITCSRTLMEYIAWGDVQIKRVSCHKYHVLLHRLYSHAVLLKLGLQT